MRPFRVIHVGAGASGICFAKFAEEMLTNVTIQIYDKNPDVVCSSPRLQCKESTR
jgi:protoporphyrinogen oxidase